jgi:hypothetical protein
MNPVFFLVTGRETTSETRNGSVEEVHTAGK